MVSVGKAPPRRAMVKCRTGGPGVGVVAWEVRVRVVRIRRERKCMVELGRIVYRVLGYCCAIAGGVGRGRHVRSCVVGEVLALGLGLAFDSRVILYAVNSKQRSRREELMKLEYASRRDCI